MEDTTLKKKDIEELEKLVKIAEEQGNNINLNLVYDNRFGKNKFCRSNEIF